MIRGVSNVRKLWLAFLTWKEVRILRLYLWFTRRQGPAKPPTIKQAAEAAAKYAPDGPVFGRTQSIPAYKMSDYDAKAAKEDNLNPDALKGDK